MDQIQAQRQLRTEVGNGVCWEHEPFLTFLMPLTLIAGIGYWANLKDPSLRFFHTFLTFGVLRVQWIKYRLKDSSAQKLVTVFAGSMLPAKLFPEKEFWADKDITFSLEQGDMLGIIGTNGAGKSTLLKVISVQVLLVQPAQNLGIPKRDLPPFVQPKHLVAQLLHLLDEALQTAVLGHEVTARLCHRLPGSAGHPHFR